MQPHTQEQHSLDKSQLSMPQSTNPTHEKKHYRNNFYHMCQWAESKIWILPTVNFSFNLLRRVRTADF